MLIRHLPDGLLLLALDGDDAVALHGTAAELWRHLDGAVTVPELAATLAGRYGEDPAVVAADLLLALRELEVQRLVVAGPGP